MSNYSAYRRISARPLPRRRMSYGTKLWVVFIVGFALMVGGCLIYRSADVDYPAPRSWATSYNGECLAGYVYDEYEVEQSTTPVPAGCTLMPFTTYVPVITSPYYHQQQALWDHRTAHSSYWDSGYYYDQVIRPAAVRHQTRPVSKDTFLSSAVTFTKANAKEIEKNSKAATWTNGQKGKYEFPSTNEKAKNRAVIDTSTTSNTKARDAGTSNSNSNRSTTGRSTTGGSSSGSRTGGGRR